MAKAFGAEPNARSGSQRSRCYISARYVSSIDVVEDSAAEAV